MKRAIAAVFVFLSLFFCSRDIISYSLLLDNVVSLVDLAEEESSKEDKSADTDETDDTDELFDSSYDHEQHQLLIVKTRLAASRQKKHSHSYYEIVSPPPESAC